MSSDYAGRMLVGCHASEIKNIPEEFVNINEWLVHGNCLERFSPWFNAAYIKCYFGFPVQTLAVEEIDQVWLDNIKTLSDKFTDLTGVSAKLIGTQDFT